MKKRITRCLALLLAVVMVLSVMPVAMAEETTQTATLVTDASSLKAGDKIILAAEANSKTYAAGALSGKFLSSVETTFTALADGVQIFTLGGKAGAWTLTGADGKRISTAAAKALNNTGSGTSTWTISIDSDGNATVASTDMSCGRILYNANSPRFLNYTSDTTKTMLLPSIYRVGAAKEKVATPTANVKDGAEIKDGDKIKVGTEIEFKCATTGATIYYTFGSSTEKQTYSEPIKALQSGTYTVWAEMDGKDPSEKLKFSVTAEEPATVPISTALAGEKDVPFTVKGVVTLVDGQNYYLQDETGGICLRLASETTEIALGDTIIGTGKRDTYKGLPQLGSGTFQKSSGLTLRAKSTTIDALTTADVCTYVTISGVEVTEVYDKNGAFTQPNITVKDAAGKTIQLYKAAINKVDGKWEYKAGDTLDITAAVGINNDTLQLRNTKPEEIKRHSDVYDPISDDMIPDGALNVKAAGAITTITENVTVVGQVVYHYGKNYNGKASIDSIILEDVIDGEIYGYQIYDYTNYTKYVVGDIVKVTGTVSPYGGVPQLKPSGVPEVIKSGLDPIAAQEITVSQMGPDYLSEYVYIKDVTLGIYNKDGNTTVTDKTGTKNLFKGVPLAANVKEADVVALYACCSAHNGTYQLRNGSSADYVTNTTPPPSGDLPKVGDKVVIYNQNAQAVLAEQNDNTDSPAINKALAEIKDGKAIPANGAVVFEVQEHEDFLRFYNETYGYLCSSGTGNNAFYSKTASEDADWTVRTCSGNVGGFEMEHRTAKFNNKHSQWLEYYSDSFKTYSMYNVTDYTIYSFYFYPVADGVNVTDGIVNMPAVDFGMIADAYVGQAYTLSFTVDAVFGVNTLTAKLGTEDLDVATTENGYSVTIPVSKVTGDKLTVTVSGQDKKGTTFEGSAEITVKDEPVISNVKPAAGTQTGENKRPTISADIVNAGDDASVTMSVNNKTVNAVYENGKVVYTPTEDLADGRTTVTVTVTRTADSKTAEMTWSFIVGTAQYQLYFGQLHSHTQYSDGSGSLDSALEYVKDLPESANVDFVAFTDHSNYFDSKNNPNVEAALYDTSLVKDSDSSHSWKTYKDTVAKFNKEHAGKMVAIAGFEMTWSGGPGHINTFNTPGIVSRNNTTLNNKDNDAGMKAYYALLSRSEGADSISQFNHPGTTFGTFKDFSYWDPVIDSRMYMVEVGNGEGQIGAGGYYPSYSEYIKALDKGWHLAPTNNQDNHKGRWGNANDARDVILTDEFSEQGIYAAIRAMRMYATEDKNLEIGYTVNGMMLGSAITEKPEKLSFHVTFRDPDSNDSIKKVELVANSGIVAYSWENAADLAKGEVSVELAPDYSYYFVRITEGDGDLAVTAPVWVGETLKLGISSAECGTASPVTDEELTITTTFFNSEAKAATIKSITYTTGSTTLDTDTTGYALAASSTLGVDFKYTPDKARVMTITVTAVIEQDGKEYTFTKDVELDVLDASQLVYIGIDASHYNEYVAGNYKDSMGNFGTLAAKYSVRTVQLNTSEELVNACSNPKYVALILTAPSRRLAAAQADPKTYSAEELAAIAAFNSKGGMVILAGWSDKYEDFDVIKNNPNIKHMAETQNDVLAALGSSLRISDDATYDDVRSAADGVDKWRLYFSDYNMENPLLDGVIYDADHPYDKLYTERFSHYGGASIYAVGADGNPTDTLPAAVRPVVYGHASTYSVDVDKDGRGGAGTPKYAFAEGDNRLMVMASEQIEGKGMIIVSGAAFMSNFEVQAQVDNAAEKNYSNYRICENLLSMFDHTVISKISAVQAQEEEGVKYTIEGIVTSNASGYDKNTAFFDCIYVQDETAGINAFPVAGEFRIGDKVRISGTTSSYQGERQIKVTSIEKRGEETPVEPKKVTAADLENKGYLGSLVTVEGTATKIEYSNGLIQTIMVRDDTGKVARIFIDGYITTDKDVENAAVGCHVVATGLASYDDTFTLDGTAIPQRIRIRNRADVVCTESETPMVWNITYVTDGGTINGSYPTTYTEGTVTVLPTDVTRDGYTFLGWYDAETNGAKVTQIEADATGDKTFYAYWQQNDTPARTWNITYVTDGGTINGSYPTTYTEGTVTVLPTDVTKSGYTFLGWFMASEGGEKVTQIGAAETGDKVFYAHWKKDADPIDPILPILPGIIGGNTGNTGSTVKLPFGDVSVSDWFYDDVRYVYANGIMDGTSSDRFAPNAPLTRAMIVTILYRMAGSPAMSGASDFKDVDSNKWFARAVAWAAANGIVNGYGSGLFGPNDPVTREQLAAILYRYTAYCKASTTANGDNLAGFADLSTVSGYALASMNWAVSEKLLKGANGKLDPKADATRAQVAAIIHRYLER